MIGQIVLGVRAATRRGKHAAPMITPPEAIATRPDGPLIWLNASGDSDQTAAKLLALHLVEERPTLHVAINCDKPSDSPQIFTLPTQSDPAALLSHWAPDLIVHVGGALPENLVTQTDTPQMVVSARIVAPKGISARFWRPAERILFARMRAVHVQDQSSAAEIERMKLPPAIVSGQISDTPEPLEASESERASFSQILRARPVWAALATPRGEERPVLAAHSQALRHAHRTLLILQTEDPTRGATLAEELEADGWTIATRWTEGEPVEETEIFLVDDPAEAGLWYRLSPLAFMGGTLFGKGKSPRSPLEAAALGSAILHGPSTDRYAADYARLEAARATRRVASASALGEAVADLLAPDRMAMLAHNAWAVTSGGAGVTKEVTHAILQQFDQLTESTI
jgi:3-deoxy-D-manno-octulosonic-acid transferase